MRIGLSWTWLIVALFGSSLLGLLIAWPFWRRQQFVIGTAVGSGVVLLVSIALVARELLYLYNLRLTATRRLFVEPDDFTRSLIYYSIAFFDVMVIFLVSQWAEDRRRARGRAKEWR